MTNAGLKGWNKYEIKYLVPIKFLCQILDYFSFQPCKGPKDNTNKSVETVMSTSDSVKLLICGSGNGAHAFAGIASSHPETEVRVLSLYQDEAERWSKALQTTDLEITCHRRDQEPSVIRSKPALITKNPEEAVRGVDVIAFVLPAFAHQVFLEALEPYIEPGVIIVGLPGASGLEFQVRGILGDKANMCTVMNFESLPWACRLEEFGRKCDVLGTKESMVGAMQVSPLIKRRTVVCQMRGTENYYYHYFF